MLVEGLLCREVQLKNNRQTKVEIEKLGITYVAKKKGVKTLKTLRFSHWFHNEDSDFVNLSALSL